jgi:A/G-specific adenine glycosylase
MGNRYLEPVLAWYGAQARDLPWRRQDASPWAVLVSEFMLQQTPVSRVRRNRKTVRSASSMSVKT